MTKPIVKHLMNGASVFVLSLAFSSAAMANYDDLSSDELREQFDEISQAEESFSGIGLYYSVVVSTDESSFLDQGVQG
ncbi:hypothetical protein ACGYLI_17125 [Sulfitobacter sp. 1A13421]|uniref:hypothetical protein n=1 Tax=Sulfitobacter sp. 1A13421 TaxID=3368595 RepID=UPI003746DAEC